MWKNDFNPFDKLKKVTFIPVLFQVDSIYSHNGNDLGFWTENSIYKYPYYLINAHHHKRQMKEDTAQKLLPESVIYADSGGLQSVILKAPQPDITELTQWQEKHSNVGFCFDVIPFMTDTRKLSGWDFDKKNFVSCAEKTLENINTALAVRTNPNFKTYSIIQGRRFQEYEVWYDIVSKSAVDGLCMKSPTNNPVNVAESALFAYYHFDKPLHFLGMSNLTKTMVIYYFSQYYKNKITFDSSTYNIGNQFRTYIHPSVPSLKIRYVKEDGSVDKNEYDDIMIFEKIYDLSFCECAACRFLDPKELQEWHETNSPKLGPLISLHNFISLNRMFTFISQICHNKSAMVQLAKGLFRESTASRVIAAFDFIDEGVTRGFDRVSEKYKSLLLEDSEVIQQTSIFSF